MKIAKKLTLLLASALVVMLMAVPVFAEGEEEITIPDGYVPAPDFIDNFEIVLSDNTHITLMAKEETEFADEDEEVPVTYFTQPIKKGETVKIRAINENCSINPDEYYVDDNLTELIEQDGYYTLPLPEDHITLQYVTPGMVIIGPSLPRTHNVQIKVIYVDSVSEITTIIDNLPEDITISDKVAIKEARDAYDALSDEDKSKVTNYDKLVAAESKLADLEAAAEFDETVGTLPDLDNLTDTDYEKIASLKEKYYALTDAQKKLVSNEAALKLAFEKLNVKELQDELQSAKDALNEALENETPESDINKLVEEVKHTKAELKDAKKKQAAAEASLIVKSIVIKKVKAKAQKRKAKVSWKSAGKGFKYEVYTSRKLSKGYKKAATVSKVKTVIKKLKSKKTYYVKIRGFKTVNGTKVYTQYSDVTSVKIK